MYKFQKTLENSISLSGIGAHSGRNTSLTLRPAPVGHGLVFRRVDLDAIIPASYKNVVDTKLCTVLAGEKGARVSTVEHLMSALWAHGITNALIEVDNEEIPILDGSAEPFSAAITSAGIEVQSAPTKFIKVLKKVSVIVDDKKLSLIPAEEFSMQVAIDFDHPMIGKQSCTFSAEEGGDFDLDIAKARTFGNVKDVEYLRSLGLARGASTENAIALTPEGILNTEPLRYSDEFARHKALDCIGDLYLGGRIIARVEGYKVGHHINNLVLHKLFEDSRNYEIVTDASDEKVRRFHYIPPRRAECPAA